MNYFKDFPEFRPNLTPRQIFALGSFGGTYWRPIRSGITKKTYTNKHREFSWLRTIPKKKLTNILCDISINNYNVRVGTSLKFWEKKGWMTAQDPYGWVQWYCRFYDGRRSDDDIRQIKRWVQLAGPKGRFRKWLITLIHNKKGYWNDTIISPKIRQTLQHWGYRLTKKDYEQEIKERNKKKINTKAKQTKAKQTKSKQTKSKQTKSKQTKAKQTKSKQTKDKQTKATKK